MSLLFLDSSEQTAALARNVYNRQFAEDARLESEYDDRRKREMYNDILFNLSYLETAMEHDDDRVFNNYAVWIYYLLCHFMKELDKERIRDHMVNHYEILKEELLKTLPEGKGRKATHHLDRAIEATKTACAEFDPSFPFTRGRHDSWKREYLEYMMQNNTRAAVGLVDRAVKSGISLEDVYIDILQSAMYEVGDLWHRHEITVDKEHYCTSTTQAALSQFYPLIFSQPKHGHRVLTCCVGSELHEMGIRMVSDLFEYHGWDSHYLGSAAPIDAILHSIEEFQPQLVGLSVTMPQHITDCYKLVTEIQKRFPDLKIAVGGRAFRETDHLWKKWGVDVSTDNAMQLIAWADQTIVLGESKQ